MLEEGELEILTFLPKALLKKEIGDMKLDEFQTYLAMARVTEKMIKRLIQSAVAEAFGTEDE